jgi:hypothetical protein
MIPEVFLEYCVRLRVGPETVVASRSVYWRRMTALQKAIEVVVSAMKADQPTAFAALWNNPLVPVFFATAYGELTALFSLSGAILDRSLPVSPKDFQHSVQNASLAYLAMTEHLHNPMVSLSSGFLSADKAMFLVVRRLQAGLEPAALLIHGHEESKDCAEAECLVLSAQVRSFWPRSHRLVDISLDTKEPNALDRPVQSIPEEEGKVAWLVQGGAVRDRRQVTSRAKEGIYTQWQRL